jgi:beta-glucosidase
MKNISISLLAAAALWLLSLASIHAQNRTMLIDPLIEKRIDELMAKMTLEEKVGQLNQYSSTFDITGPPPQAGAAQIRYQQLRSGQVGSMLNVTGARATREAQKLVVENSRLGIPLLIGYDVIHGYKTMFPIPLAEAASWDLEAIELSARVAAREASAAGIHWTFAPMVDLSRDARWGRVMEGAGEDPFLGAAAAVARVRGFQGDNLGNIATIAACAKHYAAYGFAEAGRDYNTVDISKSTLHNVVLPPFKAAAEAGVATFMNAFNEIGGEPATASMYLQRDILKGQWGFGGMVVSDWNSIGELIPHGVAKNAAEAARLAIEAGSDMDMESGAYVAELPQLARSGIVDEKWIDEAVRRVLRVKFHLGLFDDPYRYSDEAREARELLSAENLNAAREVARKSIVLLKNEGGLLPLREDLRNIAVIGPLANDKDSPLGSWRAQAETNSAVSLLEGIRAAAGGGTQVNYAEGAQLAAGERSFLRGLSFNTSDRSGFAAAVAAARRAQVVVLAIGEDCWQTGEGRSQVDIGLKGLQMELFREIAKVNKNIVVVLMNGRPLAIPEIAETALAIVEAWHLGSMAGHAIADVLFGRYNPSGKLPVSFPRHVGQVPIYYNHKNTGRPTGGDMVFWSHYTDAPNSPLYPFGHGLSYTRFDYSPVTHSNSEMNMYGAIEVKTTVTNSGQRAGAEVVQLYIRQLVGGATRPVKELKGFQKIELQPGESREVVFTLGSRDLEYYNAEGVWAADRGVYKVMVGGSSVEVKEAEFTLR